MCIEARLENTRTEVFRRAFELLIGKLVDEDDREIARKIFIEAVREARGITFRNLAEKMKELGLLEINLHPRELLSDRLERDDLFVF